MDVVVRPVRTKRRHSEEFKAAVVAACSEPGISVAGIALANGVNANLVRKWMRGRGVALPSRRITERAALAMPTEPMQDASAAPAFIPVGLAPARAPEVAIRIEMRRGETALSVSWPLEAAGSCGVWLGEWLR